MGELASMCESSFRFLNALFRTFDNQLVLHNKSETRAVASSRAPFGGGCLSGTLAIASTSWRCYNLCTPRRERNTLAGNHRERDVKWAACFSDLSVTSVGV